MSLTSQLLHTAAMNAFEAALALVLSADPELRQIVGVSLTVSLSAVAVAALIGLPLGAGVALGQFPGRSALIVLLNALMGLPPVVVGLSVYLLLSRAGPLGELGLLFTPPAMVIAQAVLVLPIIAALTRQTVEDLWAEYGEQLVSLGVSHARAVPTLLWDGRYGVLTAVLAGLGRAAAEVGAILIVGGNIAGVTRTMTTAIALETSKGELGLALALGLILIALVVLINAAAFTLARLAGRHHR
jgi:tungstate transport system permease protein